MNKKDGLFIDNQRDQHLQNYIYKKLRKSMFTD